jgi:2-dehydropantoate 2-reductase
VIPLQNGVDIAEQLAALTEPTHILGGLTYLPASVSEPGVVRQEGPEKPLLLGPLSNADDAAAEAALALFRRTGIAAERPSDIRVQIWTKFMAAIGTTGVQSVTGRGFGPTSTDGDTRALYRPSHPRADGARGSHFSSGPNLISCLRHEGARGCRVLTA